MASRSGGVCESPRYVQLRADSGFTGQVVHSPSVSCCSFESISMNGFQYKRTVSSQFKDRYELLSLDTILTTSRTIQKKELAFQDCCVRICAYRVRKFGWRVSRVSIVTTRFAPVTERELLLPVSEGSVATAEHMLRSSKCTAL
jgi:hypothetical protein